MDIGGLARRSGLYDVVEPAYSHWLRSSWESKGRPVPAPSAVKRRIILDYSKVFGLKTLVETGTYKGDTVRALRNRFDAIHSIEIQSEFYIAALRRCHRQASAHLHLGNSADLVPQILQELNGPALFWLDAHHSGGETGGAGDHPTLSELRSILSDQTTGHVVLVDDAREFGVDSDYPELSSLEAVAAHYDYSFEVAVDIARLTPRA